MGLSLSVDRRRVAEPEIGEVSTVQPWCVNVEERLVEEAVLAMGFGGKEAGV